MQWETPEHQHREKTNDWYASVIIIAGALVAIEFLLNDFLLITLTIVGTIAFLLLSVRRPEIIHVEIGSRGVRAGNILYPYSSLDGFAIAEYPHEHRLLLESNRHFLPLIVIPIPETIHSEVVHDEIAQYLPQKELHESFPHLIFERLGF